MSARAYRVAPRRPAGGRPASRIHWDRLGRVILLLVLLGIMVSYVNPVAGFVDAWRGAKAERGELQGLSAEHARLVAKEASLNKPGAAAEQARGLGMVVPGERAFVIKPPHH